MIAPALLAPPTMATTPLLKPLPEAPMVAALVMVIPASVPTALPVWSAMMPKPVLAVVALIEPVADLTMVIEPLPVESALMPFSPVTALLAVMVVAPVPSSSVWMPE